MAEVSTVRWRGATEPVVISARGRQARRASIAMLFIIVAFAFAIYFFQALLKPLSLPQTSFIFLSGDGGVPPATHLRFAGQPFAGQEHDAWQALAAEFVPGDEPLLATAADWRSREDVYHLGTAIRTRASESRDIVLVYLTAHGFVSDNTAYLRWHFGGTNPRTDELRFQEVIARIAEGKRSTKVLFLDAGGWPADARDHLAVSQFVKVVQQELSRIHDPNLWVFLANSEQEISHLMPPIQRSLFSYYLTQGLNGAANLDGNEFVDLRELRLYVCNSVADAVQQWSNGAETQTPLLLRAASQPTDLSDPPMLIPVLPKPAAGSGATGTQAAAGTGTNGQTATAGSPAGGTGGGSVASANSPASPAAASPAAASSTAPGGGTPGNSAAATPAVTAAVAGPAAGPSSAAAPASGAAATAPGAAPAGSTSATGTAAVAATSTAPASPAGTAAAAPATPAATATDSATPATGTSAAGSPVIVATAQPPAIPAGGTPWEYAWAVRDFCWAGYPGKLRIVDTAPHLWREYETELLEWEQSTSRQTQDVTTQWPDELTRSAQDFEKLTRLGMSRINEFTPTSVLGYRLVRWMQGQPPTIHSRSLALNQLIEETNPAAMPAALVTFRNEFLQAVAAPSPADLQGLLKKLPQGTSNYAEVRLALQCQALAPPLLWPLQQALIQTRIRGEALAVAELGMTSWIRRDVTRGDDLRVDAERLILDNVSPARQSQALLLLQQSQAAYDQAAESARLAGRVLRTRNDLLFRSPDYLRWWYLSQLRNTTPAPEAAELLQMFRRLTELNRWIEQRTPRRNQDIETALREVLRLQYHFDSVADQRPVNTSHFGMQYPGGIRTLNVINATVLPGAGVRKDLNSVAMPLMTQRWERVRSGSMNDGDNSIALPRAAWPPETINELMNLQLGIAELTAVDTDGSDRPLENLRLFVTSHANAAPEVPGQKSVDAQQLAFDRYESFREEFERYIWTRMSDLAKTIRRDLTTGSPDPQSVFAKLANAQRALLVARPADLDTLQGTNLPAVLRNSAWHELLSWLRERAGTAAIGASASEAAWLQEVARTYELDSHAIPGAAVMARPAPAALQMTAGPVADLVTTGSTTVQLQLQNLTASSSDVWLLADFDPRLIAVSAAADFQILMQPELKLGNDSQLDITGLTRPTLQLASGQSQMVTLNLQRIAPASADTGLIIKAITRNGIARADVVIQIPRPAPVALNVSGQPNSWTMLPDGVSLHPFANRDTDFSLSLSNPGPVEQKLHFDLVTVPNHASLPAVLPVDAYPAALMQQWLNAWGPCPPIPGMSTDIGVPAGGSYPLLFASPSAPGSGGSAGGAGAGAPPAAPASPPPPGKDLKGTPLPRGALLVITDSASNTITVRRIGVRPQHPRRYLQVDLNYDVDLERLNISVSAIDLQSLPPGPVAIRAEFAEPLPPESNVRLAGQISVDSPRLELFADVPKSIVPRRLSIDADGYPRAFQFEIPCDATRHSLPELRTPFAVRIDAPTPGMAWPGNTTSIPVQLEADAPLESLENGQATLEFGIDLNQNRILDGNDIRQSLSNDRDVIVSLKHMQRGGIYTWHTDVTDLNFLFPLQGFQNSRRSLLAQLTQGSRRVWSNPVEIIVDGQAPRLLNMAVLPPDQVKVGDNAQVTLTVNDYGLSGVSQVQVGWDVERSGELNKAPPPVPAALDESGAWIAAVPTKGITPGTYSLIVRLTDRVGNTQDRVGARYRILSLTDAAAIEAAMTGVISGTVLYGGMPQGDIKITVLKDSQPVVPVVTTDAQGIFRVPNVPQGAYQMKVEGVVRNKRRTTMIPITVDKNVTLNPFVNVVLK